jgi:hypothetical protein
MPMPTVSRALLAAALLLLAASACDGGDGGGDGTPVSKEPLPRTIVSDDGKLTLVIPAGLVEDDLDITATAVPLEQLPVELRQLRGAGAGYLLEPDGLAFDEPVEVSLELDVAELDPEPAGQTSAYALVAFSEDGGREILEGQSTEARLGEARVTVRGSLPHLSYLGITRGSLSLRLDAAPATQKVGDELSAAASALNTDSSGAVRLRDVAGEFAGAGALSFGGTEEGSSPSFAGAADQPLAFGEGVSATGHFSCASAGFGGYGVEVSSESVVEVEGVETITALTVAIDAVVVCAD